ncbi:MULTISPECIES: ferritin-like domain-containing protein [Acidobacterium]|nr:MULTISPECIES: ferritin-like domain-containing protein [Acidobacterium]
MKKLDELLERRSVSRRKFLAGIGVSAGVAAAGIAGCSSGNSMANNMTNNTTNSGGGGGTSSSITDADIFNFALNLEYLEAEFYLRAAYGMGLSSSDIGANPGNVTGGSQVNFQSSAVKAYALEIANDEQTHVQFLRKQLGSAAVDRPAIDFTNAFNAAASAAGIGSTFDPFSSDDNFLLGAFVFEDVGVTAYHGAATLLSSSANLAAAAGILGTEAYHAGEIRTLIAQVGGSVLTAATQIQALRATAGGGAETTLSASTIVNADSSSISYDRTTDQVMHIVYLSPSAGVVSKGGFFPNGLNGTISATAS